MKKTNMIKSLIAISSLSLLLVACSDKEKEQPLDDFKKPVVQDKTVLSIEDMDQKEVEVIKEKGDAAANVLATLLYDLKKPKVTDENIEMILRDQFGTQIKDKLLDQVTLHNFMVRSNVESIEAKQVENPELFNTTRIITQSGKNYFYHISIASELLDKNGEHYTYYPFTIDILFLKEEDGGFKISNLILKEAHDIEGYGELSDIGAENALLESMTYAIQNLNNVFTDDVEQKILNLKNLTNQAAVAEELIKHFESKKQVKSIEDISLENTKVYPDDFFEKEVVDGKEVDVSGPYDGKKLEAILHYTLVYKDGKEETFNFTVNASLEDRNSAYPTEWTFEKYELVSLSLEETK